MAKHIAFPSIEQFRTVIRTVSQRAHYHGTPLPKLTFSGTVKMHGTNAAVGLDLSTGEVWAQSRSNIIDVTNDNAGFAAFVASHKDDFDNILSTAKHVFGDAIAVQRAIDSSGQLVVFGEWAGGNIQKGVALNGLPKMFVIFAVCVETVVNGELHQQWLSADQVKDIGDGFGLEAADASKIYSIYQFPTYRIEIDFACPEVTQNEIVAITDAVEKECPVGKQLGNTGIGEGVVWRCDSNWVTGNGLDVKTSDLIFKVKGKKHSDTKVKVTAAVDVELVNSIREFAANVTTDHRLEKGIAFLRESNPEISLERTGEFLKWVNNDVMKEELDVITESKLEVKAVMGAVSRAARQWFLKEVEKDV